MQHLFPLPGIPCKWRPFRRLRRTISLCLLAWCVLLPTIALADIVVTLPPLAGLVSMLDPSVRVHCLLPPAGDPHTFQLTPRQAAQLKKADLLIRASRDDGGWPGLDTGIPILDLWPKTNHAWLQPKEVQKALPRLAARLQELDPEHRSQIGAALNTAIKLCHRMELAWHHALKPFKSAGVIMQHPAWRGLCEHFDIPVHAVLEPRHHGGEVTPRKLEQTLRLIRAHPATALWGDNRHSNRALIWLMRHGHTSKPVILDALGTCGMRWEALMEHNIALLEKP